MKQKLLSKTLRFYVLFSLVVIVVSGLVFYFLINRLFIHEANEELFLHKNEFLNSNYLNFPEKNIAVWNSISRDIKIVDRSIPLKRDSLFDEMIPDLLNNEIVPYRVLFSPIIIEGKPRILMARVSLIESEALIKNIARVFFIILLSLLTGLYFITKILSRRLWKPFFATIHQLENFELDKNKLPVLPSTEIEEFDRLNKAATRLLQKNMTVFKSQKEFVENASHELQTPIASFLARLDVMVQTMPITRELGEALTSLHDSASRIIRLNKNLLLLSKIENDQYASFEKVMVSSIVEKQSDFIKEQTGEKGVQLLVSISEPFTTLANLTLLEIALGNLLLNALKHNVSGGKIYVSLDSAKLRISNSGQAALSDGGKLFERFSTPASNGGSGLGLAIVRKISDLHGWDLTYEFVEGMHTFQIVFKIS